MSPVVYKLTIPPFILVKHAICQVTSPEEIFLCNNIAYVVKTVIFAVLKVKTTIRTKQTIAALLLILFVFIHVVKLFHHHLGIASSNNDSLVSKVTVRPVLHCAVCDYHFIHDADHATAFAVLGLRIIYLPVFASHLVQPTTSIGLSAADRGPPALV